MLDTRPYRRDIVSTLLGALVLIASVAQPARVLAEFSESQTQSLSQIRTQLRQAGAQYKRREFQVAGESVKAAQESLSGLFLEISDADRRRLKKVYRTLEKAHALLELEGVSLPPLLKLDLRPASDNPIQNQGFTKVVAPILVAKCGRCHINDRKGGFSAASYASLMQGVADAGVVVLPGNSRGSRIIEVIESGDMPRDGLKITADERQVIERWINDGAKFDGDNPSTSLARLAGPAAANTTLQPAKALDVLAATGKETVSFAGQIAPVLARECLGCHGGDRSRNGLSFANFDTLLKGGDSGPIIDREVPEKSLLLTKLLGTGPGQRMPLNRPPLSDALINKFQTWIREGATFDGKRPRMTLASVAALYQAENSTHEELARERLRLAQRNWNLALPESQPNMVETAHFLVVGTRSREELLEIATLAEHQAEIVRRHLRGPTSVPFIKGRATLFVVNREYDYLEFGKMVEQRQLPKSDRAHWKYSLVDAYVVIVSTPNAEVPTARLAEQIASLYVANLGTDVPHWFTVGLGRVVAARIAPRDPLVSKWKTPTKIGNLTPADFLNGRAPPETSAPVFFAFSKRILENRRAFSRLTTQLRSGEPFNKAWEATYGASPQESMAALMR